MNDLQDIGSSNESKKVSTSSGVFAKRAFICVAVLIFILEGLFLFSRPKSENLVEMYQRASNKADRIDSSMVWNASFGSVVITLTSLPCNISGPSTISPTPLFSRVEDGRTGNSQYSCWHIKDDKVRVIGNRGFAEAFPLAKFEFNPDLSMLPPQRGMMGRASDFLASLFQNRVGKDEPPAPVPTAAKTTDVKSADDQGGALARYNNLHAEKSNADWGEEDMLRAVDILARPANDADRKAIAEEEKSVLQIECVAGGCLMRQREFAAAKMMREGKAKSAREALGLDTKSASTVVPSFPPAEPQHLTNTAVTSQAVELMLGAARADSLSRDIGEQAVLRNLPRPERGDRKNAREKNSAGLTALNSGNYKEAVEFFTEGLKADRSDVELVNNLAYALLMDGQLEAAKLKLVEVLSLDIGRSGAWANLGDVFAKMGNQRDAIAAYKLTYYFSRAPEKTIEFFQKRSELDVDEKVRYTSAKAISAFSGIKPLNERP